MPLNGCYSKSDSKLRRHHQVDKHAKFVACCVTDGRRHGQVGEDAEEALAILLHALDAALGDLER